MDNLNIITYVAQDIIDFKLNGFVKISKYATYINNKAQIHKNIESVLELIASQLTKDKMNTVFTMNLDDLSIFLEYSLPALGFEYISNKNTKLKNKQLFSLRNEKGFVYTIKLKYKDVAIQLIDVCKLSMLKKEQLITQLNLKNSTHLTTDKAKQFSLVTDIKAIATYLQANPYNSKLTGSSQSFSELKKTYNEHNDLKFTEAFPRVSDELYEDIIDSYKGGIVLTNKKYLDKTVDSVSFDINSSYTESMTKELPYGLPEKIEGKGTSGLFIQKFKAVFKLKRKGIPFLMNHIRDKIYSNLDCDSEIMTLSSIDFELFEKNYEIYDIEYLYHYQFKTVINPFKEYIDKYYNLKVKSKKEHDKINEMVAKLKLNTSYGKFCSKILYKQVIPLIDTESKELTHNIRETKSKAQYLPCGIFISAYSRAKLLDKVELLINQGFEVIYTDTDSIYIKRNKDIDKLDYLIEQDEFKLGYWKKQKDAEIRVLGNKTYILKEKDKEALTIKSSGLRMVKEYTEMSEIKCGMIVEVENKVKVAGGVVLAVEEKRLGKLKFEEFKKFFDKDTE